MSGYGFSAENPIRVSGFYEEKRYLECLRKAGKNTPLKYERLGSCHAEGSCYPVDIYRLDVKGLFRQPVLLYIDIYRERDWRAPEGYMLTGPAPINDEDNEEKKAANALLKAIVNIEKIIDSEEID